MMRSFMTSGSLTWAAEPDEGPEGSDATPFHEENVIMTVLGGTPHVGEAPHVQLEPQGLDSWWWGPQGCEGVTALDLCHLYCKHKYIYVCIYYHVFSYSRFKRRRKK
jgi:hypothetical protein